MSNEDLLSSAVNELLKGQLVLLSSPPALILAIDLMRLPKSVSATLLKSS